MFIDDIIMTSNTVYIRPKIKIPLELEAQIVEIPTKSHMQGVKPDLEDNQKRWLVIGICLHSILSPAMRQYVSNLVTGIYSTLKQSDGIDKQKYSKHLVIYKPTQYYLNYESINGNALLKNDRAHYDYQVLNEVDLSKLFLSQHMAKYTGFDESCDSSALLGIIKNIDTSAVGSLAGKLRDEVRNEWAHCKFHLWDALKYMNTYQLMQKFVQQLNLSSEAEYIAKLTKWETNGIQFLQGTTLGLEIVDEINEQTSALAKFILELKSKTDESLDAVCSSLSYIQEEILSAKERLNDIRTKTKTLESNFSGLEIKVELQGEAIKQDLSCIKQDIDALKYTLYESHTRPRDKVFFYPPDRVEYFVGRKDKMMILQKAFTQNKDKEHTRVICGLGGCGKTTISIEYAWLFQGLYPGGVFWISAESDEAIEDTVSILANDINIQGANTKEVLKAALKWLSRLTKRWLLIVDNADAESLTINMKELMFGIWKRKTLGHIIITTRREPTEVEASLNVKEENCINLQMLSVEEGFEFMTKRSGRVCDEREFVFKLFEELVGLPLALEQAAAHIKSIKCSFEDYYKRFMKKRLNLLVKPAKLPFSVDDVRMVVTTTWQINMDFVRKQSHEEGLGTAAESVMKIASFLFADDIPTQIFNNGEPVINETDINDVMSDSAGVQQCIEILTRFSLFQRHRANSLSIHRLVQEVIRNNIISDLERKQILQHAVKMINKALRSNPSPTSILRRQRKGDLSRGSLTLWNKLAMNAIALKLHLWNFSSEKTTLEQVSKDFYLDKPTAYLIHTVAVYHSLLQRQDEALENQKQLLQMIASLNLDEDAYEELTSLKIPLLEKDKIHIQNCIASVLSDNECTGDVNQTALIPLSSEKLRMLGNAAYYEKRYEDALQYYTEALRAFSEAKAKIDHSVLSNRSLVNLKLNNYQQALDDANICLEIYPESWKGHAWKAYAIAYLIEEKILQQEMIGAGLCSASFAGYLNEKCLLEYKMKIYYPLITYKFVETPDMLKDDIISLTDRLFTTYMLRKGTYSLKDIVASTKSLQLFGVEEGVIINVDKGIHILRLPDSAFDIQFEQEPEINFHFENISFKSEGQILVKNDATATFYRCKFSNGTIPCEPVFNNPDTFYTEIQEFLSNEIKSEYGAISAVNGGQVTINSCQIDGCKGCGVVACRQAVLNISNSTICNAGLIGICVETGSSLTASNNDISKNKLHGIAIGKNAIGYIHGNNIESNNGEGVWFGRVLSHSEYFENESDLEEVEFTFLDNSGSNAVIANNTICRNGLSGICLEGGCCEVKDNTISDNWAWGILVQNNTSVFISNNEISGNKCGGVRDGVNYLSSVVLDGNTIRNHNGPGFYAATDNTGEDEVLEKQRYSLRPIITNRNYMYNNNKVVQITKEEVFLQLCCFCNNISSQLKFCSKCRIAKYCSKDCQKKHWLIHKNICTLFTKGYTIEINLQDTKPLHEVVEEIYHHHFQPNIVRKYDGAAPDKGNSKRFEVKIISDHLYGPINPGKSLTLYDRSLTIDIIFTNPKLYHVCSECGKLTSSKLTAKEICCWASYKDNGRILCIYTNTLLPFEEW